MNRKIRLVIALALAIAVIAVGSTAAIVRAANAGAPTQLPMQSLVGRGMYSVEATEVLFEDLGSAQLADGVAIIHFDSIFAEKVNLNVDYQVFLTPVGGWAELYIAQQTDSFFEVRATDATSDLRFHYRIVAKRLGFEDVRTEPMQVPDQPEPQQ